MKFRSQPSSCRGEAIAYAIFAVLALGLCGLCTYQFKTLAELRGQLEKMSVDKGGVAAERDAALKEGQAWKSEVTVLNDRLVALEATQKTNATEIATLNRHLRSVSTITNQIPGLVKQRDDWKKVFEEQREITLQATAATKKLKEEADTKIAESARIANENAKTANKYAADYKELAEACEKLRAQLTAPPAK
jgi:chromosome segregation ATPase